MDKDGKKTVLIIGGPTASGKSGLAVSVAQRHNGAVINADSMQVYEGLPLLSAQPSAQDRAGASHMLYEVIAASGNCSAAKWRDMALREIDNCHAQGRLPIIVGGTGFYIKTLMQGISPLPEVPADVRARTNALMDDMGNEAFYDMLKNRDPDMAARLHPANTQRLVRALEVLEHTGKSLAYWQAQPPDDTAAHLNFILVTLLPPREKLYAQCDGRFAAMLDQGALEEVKNLRARIDAGAVPKDAQLTHALGYHELCDYMDGDRTLDDAIAAATQSTRNYAKRQVTWFKNQFKPALVLTSGDAEAISALL